MKNPPLTAERLREVLDYDPTTGLFRWKVRKAYNTRVGSVAGWAHRGYREVNLDEHRYLMHRLAWLYVHGVWPKGQIDHRNEDKSDNRIANLRDVTHSQNQHNVTAARRNNLSGHRGAHFTNGRWQARIVVDKKSINLGCFDTAEQAGAAYYAAKSELHPSWG